MELGLLLGILGIVVSIGFGVWGVYITVKHRYPGKVIFVKEHSIGLFDAIVKNLPKVEVKYKGDPVSQNLVLIKGALLNNGTIDISPRSVERPITLKLPTDFKWLEASIVGSSKDVDASVKINSVEELLVETGLFRRGEYIRFQALVEVPINKEQNSTDHRELAEMLEESLMFEHRIPNTRKITTTRVVMQDSKKVKRNILILLAAGILLSATFATALFFQERPAELVYSYSKNGTLPILVSIRPMINGVLEIEGVEEEFSSHLKPDEFFTKIALSPVIVEEEDFVYIMIIIPLVYLLMPILLALFIYVGYRKNMLLIKTLNIVENSDKTINSGD